MVNRAQKRPDAGPPCAFPVFQAENLFNLLFYQYFLKRGRSAGLGSLFAVFLVYLLRVLLHRGGGSRIRCGNIARNIKKAEMINTAPGQAADRRTMSIACALNAGIGKRFVRNADTERSPR